MLGADLSDGRLHQGRQPPAHQRRRASMRPATSSSASTRSATRWAKAASPRRPSATISPSRTRCCASRRTELEEAGDGQLGEEVRVEDDPAVVRSAMPGRERDQRASCRPASSTSSRSPAPKFSTATTVPTAAPVAIDARQADQVGVIIFALFERRQRVAVDLDQRAAQRFGGGAVGDAVEPRDRRLAAVADRSISRRSTPPTNRRARAAPGCRRCR